jgi:heme/copper-type cytochrome/quinol oxidase subunit 2
VVVTVVMVMMVVVVVMVVFVVMAVFVCQRRSGKQHHRYKASGQHAH